MNILAIPTGYGLCKPIHGGQNRFSNFIKELKESSNKIIVVEDKKLMDTRDGELATIYSYKDCKLFSRNLTIFRDFNASFVLAILRALKKESVDLIQITNSPSGILAAKIATIMIMRKIPIVYDAHNVESDFIREILIEPKYTGVERLIVPEYIKVLEAIACRFIVEHIISISDRDRHIFTKKYRVNEEKISVIPSGCHIPALPNPESKNSAKEKLGIDLDRVVIFFHGSFSHPPNRDAFETIENYIAPEINKVNKKLLFLLGGTEVPKFERVNIKSLGFIDDLYDVLSAVDIAIVPITRGVGIRTKILDYLGMGLPVVTTKKGIEGIKAKSGQEAIIVDDINEAFIGAIMELADDEQERERIGANARRLAEDEYNWNKIGATLNKLYRKILTNNRGVKKCWLTSSEKVPRKD